MVLFLVLGSVVLVSLVSLIGIFSFLLNEKFLKKVLIYFVSFSAGALMGDSFIHLLPEAIEKIDNKLFLGLGVLFGIVIFLVLEKIIHWRHCHDMECKQHPKSIGYMNLMGDGIHNFLDGVLIAGSYLSSVPLGVATTLAVLFHEIPQEVGDFGVLLHSGFSRKKALAMNLLSALAAVIGAVVTIVAGNSVANFSVFILPVAAGGFIYIAGSDLIPEMHKENKTQAAILQLLIFLFGIIIMLALLAIE